MDIKFSAKMRLRKSDRGQGDWHFVTLPKNLSKQIKEDQTIPKGGRRSVKVEVRLGWYNWTTSMFRDSKYDAFILPIKKLVRDKLNLDTDTEMMFYIQPLGVKKFSK